MARVKSCVGKGMYCPVQEKVVFIDLVRPRNPKPYESYWPNKYSFEVAEVFANSDSEFWSLIDYPTDLFYL